MYDDPYMQCTKHAYRGIGFINVPILFIIVIIDLYVT